MKDKLPEFKKTVCLGNNTDDDTAFGKQGPHEPLLNDPFNQGAAPVRIAVGSRQLYPNLPIGIWENGRLEMRICKHCGLIYAEPIKS